MAAEGESFDFILDTVAADHDINAYLALLKPGATLVQVGAPEKPLALHVFSVIWRRRNFAGSLIGGIAETQEMLDFRAKHGITADIEMIRMDEIETAYARMLKSDVKYRSVIEMAWLASRRRGKSLALDTNGVPGSGAFTVGFISIWHHRFATGIEKLMGVFAQPVSRALRSR